MKVISCTAMVCNKEYSVLIASAFTDSEYLIRTVVATAVSTPFNRKWEDDVVLSNIKKCLESYDDLVIDSFVENNKDSFNLVVPRPQ